MKDLIIEWAKSKNINDPVKQTLKTLSEAGELADAVCASNLNYYVDNPRWQIENEEKIKDAIGDIEICLTILKNQIGFKDSECIEYAWDQIKNRKGKTVNGTFIKES